MFNPDRQYLELFFTIYNTDCLQKISEKFNFCTSVPINCQSKFSIIF